MKEVHKIIEKTEFRVASSGEKEHIAHFLNRIFGEMQDRRRYVEWLYSENPDCLGGGVNSIVAVQSGGGGVVGHSGAILDTLCDQKESVLLAWGADYGVDPSSRGKGYAKRLLIETLKNVDCYVNVCMAKPTIAVMKKLGGVQLGEAHILVMPLTWSRYTAYLALKNRLKSFRRKELAVLHRLLLILRRLNVEWLPAYIYLSVWKLKRFVVTRYKTNMDEISAKKKVLSKLIYEHTRDEVEPHARDLIWDWEKLVWAVRSCADNVYFIEVAKAGKPVALLCCRGPVGQDERVSVILYKIIVNEAVFRASTRIWQEIIRSDGGDAIVDVHFKTGSGHDVTRNEWIIGRRRPVVANCNFDLNDAKGILLHRKMTNLSMVDDELHRIPINVM